MSLPDSVPGWVYPGDGRWSHYPIDPWTAECPMVIEDWGGVEVQNPSLTLIAGIGAMTGMIGFWIINFGKKRLHSDMYRLPFFWFAFMNTTGILCHCLFTNYTPLDHH